MSHPANQNTISLNGNWFLTEVFILQAITAGWSAGLLIFLSGTITDEFHYRG